jgi:N6-adenosine-specific RNA methylase IME4
MDNTYHLSTLIVVRLLDAKKNHFQLLEGDEEILGLEVPYLSAIEALMYLVNYTISDIAFALNLLARYSFTLIKRHWNWDKYILRYLRGTIKMKLFYSGSNSQLIGYADAGYLFDLHKKRDNT